MSLRSWYRLLARVGDAKAATRGPGAYAKRRVRAAGHRELARFLRRVLRP